MLERIGDLIQRRAVVSSELPDPICIIAERIGFRQSVYVRPHLHGPSPESMLRSGNVGLRLCYAGRDREKCPHNGLGSYSLDSVNRSHGFILARMHPDIGGVIRDRRHRRGE
jgi:hypothetical protein